MRGGVYTYIWQASDWPSWRYDLAALAQALADVSRAQGLLMGRLADVGMALRDQASLLPLTEDVIKTSEIDGVTHYDFSSAQYFWLGASVVSMLLAMTVWNAKKVVNY